MPGINEMMLAWGFELPVISMGKHRKNLVGAYASLCMTALDYGREAAGYTTEISRNLAESNITDFRTSRLPLFGSRFYESQLSAHIFLYFMRLRRKRADIIRPYY